MRFTSSIRQTGYGGSRLSSVIHKYALSSFAAAFFLAISAGSGGAQGCGPEFATGCSDVLIRVRTGPYDVQGVIHDVGPRLFETALTGVAYGAGHVPGFLSGGPDF